MANEIFVLVLAALFSILLYWGFKVLPRERWQIFAALPKSRDESGRWEGINLTFYGLLTANAYVIAVATVLVLTEAVGVPSSTTLLLSVLLLAVCTPASKIVARIVEKKAHTFSVGGAVFIGILIVPWLIQGMNRFAGTGPYAVPVFPTLAAMAIGYAFGEGLGRLACISFGCCYGKPLDACHPLIRRIFEKRHFVFSGKTKKIAYASGLDGVRVVPIQAVTAVLFICTGLFATELHLGGHFKAAFVLPMFVTQAWRVVSETLRADYRGEGSFSPYQVMAILGLVYGLASVFVLDDFPCAEVNILSGLASLWHPGILLFLQALWLSIFLYTGRSKVTGCTLSFHVYKERV